MNEIPGYDVRGLKEMDNRMRYLHPPGKMWDKQGRIQKWLKLNYEGERLIPPAVLGRLGGEMARRMIDAALAYLTERATGQTLSAFKDAAFEDREGQK